MKEFIQKIIDSLKKAGILAEDKVASVQTELEKIELPKTEQTKIDTSKITDENIKTLIEQFQSQNNILAQEVKSLSAALAAEKDAREKSIKAQDEVAKTEKEKKIKESVDKVIKEGKFPEAKREALTKQANLDLGAFEDFVKDIPVNKHFTQTKTDDKNKTGDGNGQQKSVDGFTPNGKIGEHILATGKFVEN